MATDSATLEFMTGGFKEDGLEPICEDAKNSAWDALPLVSASPDVFGIGEGLSDGPGGAQPTASEVGTLGSADSNQTLGVFDFGDGWLTPESFGLPIAPPLTSSPESVQNFGTLVLDGAHDNCPLPGLEPSPPRIVSYTAAAADGDVFGDPLVSSSKLPSSPRSSVSSHCLPPSAANPLAVRTPLLPDIPCTYNFLEADCPMWGQQSPTDFLMDPVCMPTMELVSQLDDALCPVGSAVNGHLGVGTHDFSSSGGPQSLSGRPKPGQKGGTRRAADQARRCKGSGVKRQIAFSSHQQVKKVKTAGLKPVRQAMTVDPPSTPTSSLSARGRCPKPRRMYTEDDESDDTASEPNRRRKHHNPWDVEETAALVEGVERCGEGKWAEIKKLSFPSIAARSAVDLKDKWRNLMRVALAPKSHLRAKSDKKREIPPELLARVCALAAAAGKKLRLEPKGGQGRVSSYLRRYIATV